MTEAAETSICALIVGDSEAKVFSLGGRERVARLFSRLGLKLAENAEAAAAYKNTIIVNGAYAIEERVLKDLIASPSTALYNNDEAAEQSIIAVNIPASNAKKWSKTIATAKKPDSLDALNGKTPSELSGDYNVALRKREAPFVGEIISENVERIERTLFQQSYKGATDFVTKYLWPRPAFHVTKASAALGLSPNLITTFSLIFVLAAMYFFYKGQFALGFASAWLMCFLDTVDGKLARVTLQSSKWGNIFDHGIDLIHPPFWYWAFAAGLISTSAGTGLVSNALINQSLWIIVATYILGRLEEGYFLGKFGMEIHVWRPIDTFFRTITARRNPNLAILMITSLFGAPAIGFVLVAAWSIFSLLFHAVRIIAAHNASLVESWMLQDRAKA